jgi:LuxR family maltose regulon positive regulatory protein
MLSPAPELYESKLEAPWARPGLVSRTALVERLLASRAPITAVVAPPGYGKTTVLAQWSERNERGSAWVSLDSRDNDLAVLLGYLASALDRVEPIDTAVLRSLTSPGMVATAGAIPLFASILSSRNRPFSLVLDHLEFLNNQPCLDAIVELALHLPRGSQLAVASRTEPPFPMAHLRAQGQIIEIGGAELAMGEAEAQALLAGAGVELDAAELTKLVERTEGWPVGLYLAAFALKSHGAHRTVGLAFSGDDRLMADYLRSEVLAHLSPSTTQFLRRTAILERLSGPLCDAVLGVDGSREVLETLERSNLLLVPLDRRREWYRYHHMFRDLLRDELMRSEAGLVPLLDDRAAGWLEANGLPDAAIDHAQAAGDAHRAARLFAARAQLTYSAGRMSTALRWLGWFEAHGLIDGYPQVAVLGALGEAMMGRPTEAERWADVAQAGSLDGLLPDGSPLDSWVALLDAYLCRRGVARMREDAERARDRLAPASPFLGGALFLEGVSYVFDGELDTADPILAHAFDVCLRTGGVPTASLALAERAVVAIDRHDGPAAGTLADQAVALIEDGHCQGYLTSMLVYAVAARTAVHRGDVALARDHAARASRLRTLCTYAFPSSAQFLLQLGYALLELADPAGARAVLRQVRDILQMRPDLGIVPKQAEELQSMVDTIGSGRVGASALTVAELRLLPLLASHFTFREIGERTHVSRHTVKTHAMSIYRKFGVSSRSEAIQHAQEVGLLGV